MPSEFMDIRLLYSVEWLRPAKIIFLPSTDQVGSKPVTPDASGVSALIPVPSEFMV